MDGSEPGKVTACAWLLRQSFFPLFAAGGGGGGAGCRAVVDTLSTSRPPGLKTLRRGVGAPARKTREKNGCAGAQGGDQRQSTCARFAHTNTRARAHTYTHTHTHKRASERANEDTRRPRSS